MGLSYTKIACKVNLPVYYVIGPKPAMKKAMSNQPDTEDIDSYWEGLRPPRDPSTFINVPVVDGVALSGPVGLINQPEDEDQLEAWATSYSANYGEDSALEVSESNVTFTTIADPINSGILTDPPYSFHVSGTERSNRSLFRELVYTTVRLRNLLSSAGIRYNFTRLIDGIDTRAQDLNIGPEDPRLSYFQEMSDLLANSEDDHARR